MPTITGTQKGTALADSFIGEETLFSEGNEGGIEPGFPLALGINDATILARGGDDTISGSADSGVGEIGGIATAIGINGSLLLSDIGNDVITATGTSTAAGSGVAASFGLRDSAIFSSDGDDTVRASAEGSAQAVVEGSAIDTTFINTGDGADSIIGRYEVDDPDADAIATGSGLNKAGIRSGEGRDTIDISANVSLAFFSVEFGLADSEATVYGAKDTLEINGGTGNDTFNFSSSARAVDVSSFGLDKSRVLGGDGDDTIGIESTSGGIRSSEAIAVGNRSRVSGGRGDDVIDIAASGNSGGLADGDTNVYGVQNASVDAGSGDDVITIDSNGDSVDNGLGVGADNAKINAANGDDVVTITASGFGNSSGIGIGLLNSTVRGGTGDDTITISASALGEDFPGGLSFGARSSKIVGGLGNDRITINALSGQGLNIDDVVLGGGQGDDTFDVGIGGGTINGGGGRDTVVLDYLQSSFETFEISTIGGGIAITSDASFGFNTSQGTWTQTIKAEVFTVDGVAYSAADIVSTFG